MKQATKHIGVDIGKRRIDAVAVENGRYVSHLTIDFNNLKYQNLSRSYELGHLRNGLYELVCELGAGDHAIWIEEPLNTPYGRRTSMDLSQTAGALMTIPVERIHLVNNASWKADIIGTARASKDHIRAVVAKRLHSAEEKFGDRQDLYDAGGIALYGELVAGRLLD